jgi:hypothetical protein
MMEPDAAPAPACLASTLPGGPGQPSGPTMGGLPSMAGRTLTKAAESPPDQEGESSIGVRKYGPGDRNRSSAAPGGARASIRSAARRKDWCAARRSAPSPYLGEENKRKAGLPGAAKHTGDDARPLLR